MTEPEMEREREFYRYLGNLLVGVGAEHSPYEPGRIRGVDDVIDMLAMYYGREIAEAARSWITFH
jgi:hypothetical protein